MPRLSRSRTLIAVTGVFGLAAGLALSVAVGYLGEQDGGQISEADWGDVFTAEELLAFSQAVVLATLVEEAPVTRQFPSPANPDVVFVRLDLDRVFLVEEVWRGDQLSSGERLTVPFTLSHSRPTPAGSRSVDYPTLSLTVGQSYVLFLLRFPDEGYGDYWGVAAPEAAVATLAPDGQLTFVVSHRYRDAAAAAGLVLDPASGTPFTLSRDAVLRAPPWAPLATEPSGDADPRLALALAFEQLLTELDILDREPAAILERAHALGLTPGAFPDRPMCTEYEQVLSDLVGSSIPLCP